MSHTEKKIIIAGQNGVGKTTFARESLSKACISSREKVSAHES